MQDPRVLAADYDVPDSNLEDRFFSILEDAARDDACGRAGVKVVRFTEHEIWHDPAVVVAR